MKKLADSAPDTWEKLAPHLLVFAKVLAIAILALVVERLIYVLLRTSYERRKAQGRDDVTRYRFLRNGVRFMVSLVALAAVVYTIPSVKSLAVTLFAGAGILGLLIGLSAQKAFSNIISGVFIVSFKPFRVGDMVHIGDPSNANTLSGTVEDITLRHTVILTFENRRIIIPNAVISDATITNSTIRDEATCEFVEVPVGYSVDLDRAMRALREVCLVHPDRIDRRTAEELAHGTDELPVRLVRMGDSNLVLRAYVWARDPVTARMMHYDLNKAIVERFRREDIEIPYPHRVVVHRNETATPAGQPVVE